jgi:phenylpropionate dioxygenase-like ring-hydroxylating dioxygenase large terminal subunit
MVDVIASPPRPVYRLPPEAYYSREWYEREQANVFRRTWNLVGHVSELSGVGDYLTTYVGGEPIVAVRAGDGTIRAYVNICRHRGMVVVGGRGNCGSTLRCFYHGWEWSLEGELERVPQRRTQFADIDASTLGLLPCAAATWGGFVFVHPDPAAQSLFGAWLGDFPDHCGEYPWDDLVELDRRHYDVACNWKLFIENHIDWLHLWYLHETTVAGYDHHDGAYGHEGLNWYSAERLRTGEAAYQPVGLDPPPGLSLDEQRTVRANLLFPNVPFVMTGNAVLCFVMEPTGPETSELDMRIYGMPGSTVSDETWALLELIVIDEDARACEQMQRAIHSPRFAVGPLAVDHERPIEEFQANLLALLG